MRILTRSASKLLANIRLSVKHIRTLHISREEKITLSKTVSVHPGGMTTPNGGVSVVGQPPNFWLFSNRDGFDLTHPPTPTSPPVQPRLSMATTTSRITIAPVKTALIIVDMQNVFLSSALGRQRGEGHDAEDVLLKYGIPAARKSGVQIIWLTWGIPEDGLAAVPPVLYRVFGWQIADHGQFVVEDDSFHMKKLHRNERKSSSGGLGEPLGEVKLEDGSMVDAGKMLVRDQWNTALHPPLERAYQEGMNGKIPDVRFHKERLSGLWGGSTPCQSFIQEQGFTTLLFAGVNTDQCVLACIQDACNKSWDTVILEDGCGTTSPEYTKKAVRFNCQKSWGFVSSCAEFSKGVEQMLSGSRYDDDPYV